MRAARTSPRKPTDNAAYRFPVSAKGVVMRAGAVALRHNERGEWELPGGKFEADESPADCVVREHGLVRWVPLGEVPSLLMPDGYRASIRDWAAKSGRG